MSDPKLTESKAWKELKSHAKHMKSNSISELFKHNPHRASDFTVTTPFGIFDFAKNNISSETIDHIRHVFSFCNLESAIDAQFKGVKINKTENRAALHTALRNIHETPNDTDLQVVNTLVRNELLKIEIFSNKVRNKVWKGFSGENITDIVNIGIGGSDLGPKMAYEALLPFKQKDMNVHFVSNIDGSDLVETLNKINPAKTVFIIASKTFTTLETMTNAESAKRWFLESGKQEDIEKHFVAVSTNQKKVEEFGINPQNMFTFWEWVGGRFSVWSSIGLSLCIAIGYENFEKFLEGANWMDNHFREEPLERNIPKLMAGIGILYRNFFDAETQAVLPYDHYLSLFPAYLQQVDMESNGKTVQQNGANVEVKTGPVVWGKAGTNGQHAFYQLIHQGTALIPCDFIGFKKSQNNIGDHHNKLMANFFAQPEALMNGKSLAEVKKELIAEGLSKEDIDKISPSKVFIGNRPSSSFLLDELNPYNLGALIAAYEQKIFTQGVIWNINSFDQWGVELGKQLAGAILPELVENKKVTSHDDSTNSLINYFNKSDK